MCLCIYTYMYTHMHMYIYECVYVSKSRITGCSINDEYVYSSEMMQVVGHQTFTPQMHILLLAICIEDTFLNIMQHCISTTNIIQFSLYAQLENLYVSSDSSFLNFYSLFLPYMLCFHGTITPANYIS